MLCINCYQLTLENSEIVKEVSQLSFSPFLLERGESVRRCWTGGFTTLMLHGKLVSDWGLVATKFFPDIWVCSKQSSDVITMPSEI